MKSSVVRTIFISFVLVLTLVFILSLTTNFSPFGFVTNTPNNFQTKTISINENIIENKILTLPNDKIYGLKINGFVNGIGNLKITLENENISYLVFEKEYDKETGNVITGNVVADIIINNETNNETNYKTNIDEDKLENITDNQTLLGVDQESKNITPVNSTLETDSSQVIINKTFEENQTINESENETIVNGSVEINLTENVNESLVNETNTGIEINKTLNESINQTINVSTNVTVNDTIITELNETEINVTINESENISIVINETYDENKSDDGDNVNLEINKTDDENETKNISQSINTTILGWEKIKKACEETCSLDGLTGYSLHIEIDDGLEFNLSDIEITIRGLSQTQKILDQEVALGETLVLNLSDYFYSNEEITYDVPEIDKANFSLNNELLTITPNKLGKFKMFVYAVGDKLVRSNKFVIDVVEKVSPKEMFFKTEKVILPKEKDYDDILAIDNLAEQKSFSENDKQTYKETILKLPPDDVRDLINGKTKRILLSKEDAQKLTSKGKNLFEEKTTNDYVMIEANLQDLLNILKNETVNLFADEKFSFLTTESLNLTKITESKQTYSPLNGEDVSVCLVDSGVNVSVLGLTINDTLYGYNVLDGGENIEDDYGHGTMIAYSLLQAAPNITLYVAKVIDVNGDMYSSDIISGLQWCADKNVDIVSLSLGEGYYEGYCDDRPVANKVNQLSGNGTLVVVASGNNGEHNAVMNPACASESLRVAGSTKNNTITSFTNYNNATFLSAPAYQINTKNKIGEDVIVSGTSMSSPFVAGAAALLIDYDSSLNVSELKERLIHTSTVFNDAGRDFGQLNLLNAIEDNVTNSFEVGSLGNESSSGGFGVLLQPCASGILCDTGETCISGYCRAGCVSGFSGVGCSKEGTPQEDTLWSSADAGTCATTQGTIWGCDADTETADNGSLIFYDCSGISGGSGCDSDAGGNYVNSGVCVCDSTTCSSDSDSPNCDDDEVAKVGSSYFDDCDLVAGGSACDSDVDGSGYIQDAICVCPASSCLSDSHSSTCDVDEVAYDGSHYFDDCDLVASGSASDSSVDGSGYSQDGVCVCTSTTCSVDADSNFPDTDEVAFNGTQYFDDCDLVASGSACDSNVDGSGYIQDGVCVCTSSTCSVRADSSFCDTGAVFYDDETGNYYSSFSAFSGGYDYDVDSGGDGCDTDVAPDYSVNGMWVNDSCLEITPGCKTCPAVRVDASNNNYFVSGCDSSEDLCSIVDSAGPNPWIASGICVSNSCDTDEVAFNGTHYFNDCSDVAGGSACDSDVDGSGYSQDGVCVCTSSTCSVDADSSFCDTGAVFYDDETGNYYSSFSAFSGGYDYDVDPVGDGCDADVAPGYSVDGMWVNDSCLTSGVVRVDASNNNYFVSDCDDHGYMCDSSITPGNNPWAQNGNCADNGTSNICTTSGYICNDGWTTDYTSSNAEGNCGLGDSCDGTLTDGTFNSFYSGVYHKYVYFNQKSSNGCNQATDDECLGTNDDTSDDNCCADNEDFALDSCVHSSICYLNDETASIGSETGFCENGYWVDVDGGTQSICESAGFNWTKAGEIFGEYNSTSNVECCGDDSGENFFYKKASTTATFEINWSTSQTDNACCDTATDCLAGGTCYDNNADASGLNPGGVDNTAFCYGTTNTWRDCDGDQTTCESASQCNMNWVTSGDGSIGEYGASNDGGDGTTECCGDDNNENYFDIASNLDSSIDGSPTGDACCSDATDCFDGSNCQATGYHAGDIDSDGDTDYCNAGTWYDCYDLDDCLDGQYCSLANECITQLPLGNVFEMKNKTGGLMFSIDESGDLFVPGNRYESQGSLSPPDGSFVIKNSAGNVVTYFTGAGDLYMLGSHYIVSAMVPSGSNLILRNSTGIMAYFDDSGNIRLNGFLVDGYSG